ncbi:MULTISPECIES: ACT domain-containing protein [unclassified Paraflavitalea]|uniref:ACT domain-containing protein n=1 Tax=unclassified Paraflavitalea TaxID=2798305 RepID=UPI003D332527
MSGEKDLAKLLQSMSPVLNEGEYVFCTMSDLNKLDLTQIISFFKEQEGYTVILRRQLADHLGLSYSFIASWITLTVHSSLEAVGLTAAFSNTLAANGISCNVVAGYYHDHIFVDRDSAGKAIDVLKGLTKGDFNQ